MSKTKAVAWPAGFSDFYYKVRLNAEKIRTGTLVSVDPASGGSSLPGFAVYEAGVLVNSGTIKLNKKAQIQERLGVIYESVAALVPTPPDVFAIELLRGRMVNWTLQWASGAAIAASRAPVLIEVPILCWKKYAETQLHYVKDDELDAIMMGATVIALAREAPSVDPRLLPKKPKSKAGAD